MIIFILDNMKNKILIVSTIFLSFSLTSCFNSDDLLEKYKTPELFFERVTVERATKISISSIKGKIIKDIDFEIKNELLEVEEYKVSNFFSPPDERHFTYYFLVSNATSGPNYAEMNVYESGKLRITAKSSLGSPSYAYYTFDSTKAFEINDFVENKINNYVEPEQEVI